MTRPKTCWRGMPNEDVCEYYDMGACVTNKEQPQAGLTGMCELVGPVIKKCGSCGATVIDIVVLKEILVNLNRENYELLSLGDGFRDRVTACERVLFRLEYGLFGNAKLQGTEFKKAFKKFKNKVIFKKTEEAKQDADP